MKMSVTLSFQTRRSLGVLVRRMLSPEVPQPQSKKATVQENQSRNIIKPQKTSTRPRSSKIPLLIWGKYALPQSYPDDQADLSSLPEGYKAEMQRGTQPESLDPDGQPTWGEWGIPFKKSNIAEPVYLKHAWLRDNCRCSECVNQDTMQRAFDTFSIPRDIMPSKVVIEVEGNHGNHDSLYPWDWLQKHQRSLKYQRTSDFAETTNWGAKISESPPSVHYDEIMSDDKGVGKWTEKIRRYGFSYVDGCPVSPEKTQELLERIAFIRITHYGGFYDFTSDLTMKDTAYTSLALGPHTDTTYFTDSAGLQMFHLLSHTHGEGGKSLLVDGFKAAYILKQISPNHYRNLLHTAIPWHASGNEGVTITPGKAFPVLTMTNEPHERHRLLQVRWNNDDRSVVPIDQAEWWYESARLWSEILNREDMQYWAQLEPGRPLIFDNWRVLHGRSAFTGKRRICGGYINHDDFISRWRNTNYSREEVLKQIL